MILKNSKIHRINKKRIKQATDIYLDTNNFLHNRNNKEENSLLLNINNIIISNNLILHDQIFIEDSDVRNIYIEDNKNLGGITIPYMFFQNRKPLVITNNKIKNRINKINILFDNEVKTIDLKENFTNIIISNNRVVDNELCIELENNKKKIEYYVDENGNIKENLVQYDITLSNLNDGVLDLRKFNDYNLVKNNYVKEIEKIIIDKKIIKNKSMIKEFIYDDSAYRPGKYFYSIKKLEIVDEDDMRLIPTDKIYSLKGASDSNVIDGYHYIYLPNEGNDTLIYIDKSNNLKIIEKNNILQDENVEKVYFKINSRRDAFSSIRRKISLILIEYKAGNHKIINFDKLHEIDKIFNNILLLHKESLNLSPQIISALESNRWNRIINASTFDNDMFIKMTEVYNKYNHLLVCLKIKGLSDNAIKYLFDRNFAKTFLENLENNNDNNEIISKEIETFNELGEEYRKLKIKKLILKKQ